MVAITPHHTSGDDIITHNLSELRTGWYQMIFAGGGNDTMNIYAAKWGQDFIDRVYGKWTGADVKNYQGYQRHVYGGPGDDQLNMIFSPFNGTETLRLGHHIYGDTGSDTFNFQGAKYINPGMTVVGRIEDFDVTRDKLQLEGKDIDLANLPDGVRIVEYNGAYYDDTARPQQWILIENSRGGQVFYALEGVRYDINSGGSDETHFIRELPDFNTLKDVEFEDVHPYVAYSEYKDLDPDRVIEYYNRDHATDQALNTSFGKLMTIGSDDASIVDVINASAGYDYIYARGGDDLIAGGNSTDYLYGESGNDKIWAGTEEDQVYGGSGDDYIEGNYGADLLLGNAGADVLLGGQDDDVIYGDSMEAPDAPQIWQIRGAFRPYFVGEVHKDQTITYVDHQQFKGVAFVDDDGTLEDDVNDAETGQTLDQSMQMLKADAQGSLEGSYVYTPGYFDVVNETTGEVGKLYHLNIDRNYSGTGTPNVGAELYALDKNMAENVSENDKIIVTSDMKEVGHVDYAELGRLLEAPSTLGGDDVVAGNSGDDLLFGGVGDDELSGGAGKDVLNGDGSELPSWNFEHVFAKSTFAGIGLGKELTFDGAASLSGLSVVDNDGTLEDDTNHQWSGQTRDTSMQRLSEEFDGLSEGTYVYSHGYCDVTNETTGEVGKLYQVRMDKDYSGEYRPHNDAEYYVFDKSMVLNDDDKLTVTSLLYARGNVDYIDIADLGKTPGGLGGHDTVNGDSGDDLLFGGMGDDILDGGDGADQLYGGSGDDKIYFDEDDRVVSGGEGNNQFILLTPVVNDEQEDKTSYDADHTGTVGGNITDFVIGKDKIVLEGAEDNGVLSLFNQKVTYTEEDGDWYSFTMDGDLEELDLKSFEFL